MRIRTLTRRWSLFLVESGMRNNDKIYNMKALGDEVSIGFKTVMVPSSQSYRTDSWVISLKKLHTYPFVHLYWRTPQPKFTSFDYGLGSILEARIHA